MLSLSHQQPPARDEKERPEVTSTLPTEISGSPDEIRTEAAIVLRTVEHITFDLDSFSRTIRAAKNASPTVISDIERHLAQARRHCADATAIAQRVVLMHEQYDEMTSPELKNESEHLRYAFDLLALADAAYVQAFEVASNR
jgi:hypothetical protein